MRVEPSVRTALSDDDLLAIVDLASRLGGRGPGSLHDLRYLRSTVTEPLHVLARVGDASAGFGYAGMFPGTEEDPFIEADVAVLPEFRRRGIGSALLGTVSDHARRLGKEGLQVEVDEREADTLAFLERRGYAEVERQMQVVRDLTAELPEDEPLPEGIDVVTRAERPDLLREMYAAATEAMADVPGLDGEAAWTFEDWRAWEIDRPSNRPELCFIAVHGDEVVGYAVLQAFEQAIHHGFTAVRRAWRRRGVGRALTLRQIAGASAAGYRQLFCESEERNVPMRRLTESLGYRPLPAVIVLRGPLV